MAHATPAASPVWLQFIITRIAPYASRLASINLPATSTFSEFSGTKDLYGI